MKQSRARLALVVLAVAIGLSNTLSAVATQSEATTELVYVGTQEGSINCLRINTASGKLTMLGQSALALRPTWVTAHPQLPVLYAVDDDNAREGSITAFNVDHDTGALTEMSRVPTEGTGTTNLYFDVPSDTLLAANYGSGSVSSIAVNRDGNVDSVVSTITESGSGPNRRQASAHAHNAIVDPSGKYVLVADLGADRVFVYGLDRSTHKITAIAEPRSHAFVSSPGSGPRHLAFGSDGRFVYLITELSANVMVFRWDASHGSLTLVQTLQLNSVGFHGVGSGAEIAVSHDGRFVYAENRGENELVVYHVDPESGELSEIQRARAGGDKPWGLAIDVSGKWMVVANQRSGSVNVFGIDSESGMIVNTGQSIDIRTPVSIAFVR
ncbi:lactonase family protein [Caballeronia sp. LjRoot34]|uniref:lactonase family protein n=1 Tax=Caballeronia sp. LjRoot34 TaxID=3342325 RepID=UPI003ECFE387